jgi:hypothetical protein
LRLVKKLPGQPPSGAMVPWVAPGASPSVMKQAPPAAAVSRQRPARSIGGGVGGGGEGGGAAATGGGSGLGALAQAASATSTSKAAAAFAPYQLKDLTRVKWLIVTASSG